MELASKLTLEMLGEPFLLEKRIELLHAIEKYGSISKAAKAVPMSYKSAWDAVDTMNALSPQPIVCRETGGKDGGGTTITEYGHHLLQNYALLKEEHRRFLQRLSELTDLHSGTFQTIGRLAMQISARNQIQTEIISLENNTVNSTLGLRLKSGQALHASITKEAVENLGLQVGETVVAICKSSAVLVSLSSSVQGYENVITGKVVKMEEDIHHTKVTVDIGSHDTIVSVMNTEEIPRMALQQGADVRVAIKANDIMIGK
ncbi:MAG: molybdenum transport regulatory protein [Pseudomonadota bacterium]|jgi:molybdate transport system regulatory protein